MLTLFSEARDEAVKVMVLVVPGKAVDGTLKSTVTLTCSREGIEDLKGNTIIHTDINVGGDKLIITYQRTHFLDGQGWEH